MEKIKKIAILSCLMSGLLLSVSARAGTCIEGNEITIEKHTYCQSKVTMNWFSAVAWCHAQDGRRLLTLSEACPLNSCEQFRGKFGSNNLIWLATAGANAQMAYWVKDDSSKGTMTRNISYYALCY